MQRGSWNVSANSWQNSGSPLTFALIAINFLTMVLVTFRVSIADWLAFVSPGWLARPWTLFTYPLLSTHILSFIFFGLWLWWIGSSLERAWGTRFFAIYFFVLSAISALGITLGSAVLKVPDWAESWLPLAALTVTFCLLNPGTSIHLWGIVPIPARIMAIGTAVVVFFLYAQDHLSPLTGIFALTGCLAAYLWVMQRDRLPRFQTSQPRGHRPTTAVPRDDRTTHRNLNPFEWLARRRRKKQFERLMRDD